MSFVLECTDVLPAYMSVCHTCGVPTEARERHQILWNWNCRTLSWEGGKTGGRLQSQPEEYCEPVEGYSLISVTPSPRSSEPGFILTCYKANMPNPACEKQRPVGVASSIVVIAQCSSHPGKASQSQLLPGGPP